MSEFLIIIGAAMGAMVIQARRSRRHAPAGDYDCALRPVSSDHWEHGQGRVGPGTLTFRRTAGRGGVRLGVRAQTPRTIEVTGVDGAGRRPTSREARAVNPRASIYRLRTGEGDIELAVVAPDPDDVVRGLATSRD